jgi:cell wall-associated NlpC family hydrolase
LAIAEEVQNAGRGADTRAWESMSRRGTSRGRAVAAAALAAFAAGCASTGAVPQPFPRPAGSVPDAAVGASAPPPPSAAVGDGYAIAGTALNLRGAPYRNGGSDPSGFDCSGFVWYVFGQHGIRVARTVGEQFREGVEIRTDTIEPGDLLFFATQGPCATHVGMAIGGDEFVHAPSTRGEVRVERFSAPYWASKYVGARRIR